MEINYNDKKLILNLIDDELTNRSFHECEYMQDLKQLKRKLEMV